MQLAGCTAQGPSPRQSPPSPPRRTDTPAPTSESAGWDRLAASTACVPKRPLDLPLSAGVEAWTATGDCAVVTVRDGVVALVDASGTVDLADIGSKLDEVAAVEVLPRSVWVVGRQRLGRGTASVALELTPITARVHLLPRSVEGVLAATSTRVGIRVVTVAEEGVTRLLWLEAEGVTGERLPRQLDFTTADVTNDAVVGVSSSFGSPRVVWVPESGVVTTGPDIRGRVGSSLVAATNRRAVVAVNLIDEAGAPDGTRLYCTHDAGRTWSTSPAPRTQSVTGLAITRQGEVGVAITAVGGPRFLRGTSTCEAWKLVASLELGETAATLGAGSDAFWILGSDLWRQPVDPD